MTNESRPESDGGSRTQEEKSPHAAGDGTQPGATTESEGAPQSGGESAAGPAGQAEPQVYADRCYRSPGALAGGVLLLLLALWLGADVLVNGDGRTRLIAAFGLLFAVPLVVAFTLRPAVYAGQQRMRVRNPFRTITVPWGTVEGLRAGYSNEVVAGGTKYQLWSIPVSLRARKRAARQTERAERAAASGETANALARPTGLFGLGGVPGADDGGEKRAPSDKAIDDLRALAADNGEKPAAQGEVTVRWAYEIAAPALVGAIALAVLFAAG
ncbi:PH domain-containing protein [Streptomyces bathyalis]|uniref:PH domain-containing protein n=1 Tax=Streptomyces bathyalis TaxID=2710756 RepID=A0A7T1WRT5_9ACTN|nr:PH domain-containing protein [Streptomyces bathyalis]QPP06864.1 PH domain-containing protein [Streptomyces bathyalis]